MLTTPDSRTPHAMQQGRNNKQGKTLRSRFKLDKLPMVMVERVEAQSESKGVGAGASTYDFRLFFTSIGWGPRPDSSN